MKKIISMILCLALLMGLAVGASAAEYTEVTIAQALEIAGSLASGESTTEKYCMTGTVDDLYNTTYGNMHLLDGKGGDITIYGLYDANGNRYDAMTNAPTEGDVITVYGILKNYNGTLEVVNAVLVSIDSSNSGSDSNDQTTTVVPDEVAKYATSINTSYTYALGVYQGAESKMMQLYFNGEVANSYYLGTTQDISESPEITVESVSGGYQIYFTKDGTKTYIGIAVSGTHYNLVMAEAPTVFEWDSTNYSFTTTIDGVKVYVGTYDNYTTLSASVEEKIGDSYYYLHLYVVDTNEDTNGSNESTDPTGGNDDSNSSNSGSDNSGSSNSGSSNSGSSNSGSSNSGSSNSGSSNSGSSNSGSSNSGSSNSGSSNSGSSNSGSSNSGSSNSGSSNSGSTSDKETNTNKDDEKVEDTDKVEEEEEVIITTVISAVSAPKTGVAYKLGCKQENLETSLYFTGTSANQSYYMSTSETYDEGVDVYLEEVDGGYLMYFMDGETKTYLDIYQNGDYVNLQLTTDPVSVYTWNEEYQTLVTVVNDTEYYMGTYNTFSTLSASNIKYISTSFPCHLYEQITSTNVKTGDSIEIFVAMMAVAAIGAGVLVSKKKEF